MPYDDFVQQFSGFTGFFDTGDPDLIYEKTGSGITAYAKPGVTKYDGKTPYAGDISSLPKFNIGFVTDFAKSQYNQGQIQLSSFGSQPIYATPQAPGATAAQPSVSGIGLTTPLQFGSQGDQVKQLQEYLIAQGFQIPAGSTGYFGDQTKQALAAFQQAKGITQDKNELGFFGPKTMAFIGGQTVSGGTPYGSTGPGTSDLTKSIQGIGDLFSSSAITALEKKIADQSAAYAAGVGVGGATAILSDLFTKFGIESKLSAVEEYNKIILDQQKLLKSIPEDIKKTMEDVGISESQYNRLVLKETQKPLETLSELMQAKGAAESAIQNSLQFVKLFADVAMQDQAAKLEAMKFEIETNKDLLKTMGDKQMKLLGLALDEKKEMLTIANTAMQNGAPKNVIDKILNSDSAAEALSIAAESGFSKKQGNWVQYTQDGQVWEYQEDANGKIVPGSQHKVFETDGSGGGFTLTPTQKNGLAAFGFTPDDINGIETDVKQFGLEPVLVQLYAVNSITDAQAAALMGAYGLSEDEQATMSAKVAEQLKETQGSGGDESWWEKMFGYYWE